MVEIILFNNELSPLVVYIPDISTILCFENPEIILNTEILSSLRTLEKALWTCTWQVSAASPEFLRVIGQKQTCDLSFLEGQLTHTELLLLLLSSLGLVSLKEKEIQQGHSRSQFFQPPVKPARIFRDARSNQSTNYWVCKRELGIIKKLCLDAMRCTFRYLYFFHLNKDSLLRCFPSPQSQHTYTQCYIQPFYCLPFTCC